MSTSEERIMASIAHIGIIIGYSGIVIALIIYFLQRQGSEFIFQHAKQALGYQITIAILFIIIRSLALFGLFTINGLILMILHLVFSIYALYGSYQAFKGKKFSYAVIGKYIK